MRVDAAIWILHMTWTVLEAVSCHFLHHIHQSGPQTSHFMKPHEFEQGIGAEIAYVYYDFLVNGFLLRKKFNAW